MIDFDFLEQWLIEHFSIKLYGVLSSSYIMGEAD